MIVKLGEQINETELRFEFRVFGDYRKENLRPDIYSLKLLFLALKKKKVKYKSKFLFVIEAPYYHTIKEIEYSSIHLWITNELKLEFRNENFK